MTQLDLHIDFRSDIALYTQIVEQIQNRVLSGELKPGDQLPTVRQLAAELRVNFNTVARAYRILDELGLISTQQGRGTYIWDPMPPAKEAEHRRRALGQITRHFFNDAAAMGFAEDEIRAEFEQQMKMLRMDFPHPQIDRKGK
ncbi:MAG: GntR family transcriptional regulator [Bellilinea sp.]